MKKTRKEEMHSHEQEDVQLKETIEEVPKESVIYENDENLEESDRLIEEGLENLLSAEQKKVLELEDLLKRQVADFENYRKRMQEEREKIKDTSQEAIILDFLPVFDNLERAFESFQAPGATLDSLKTGLEGIKALFIDFLSRWHVQEIDSVGQPFDPKLHEALFMQEGDYTKKEVIQEVEKAYTRKDKVIRTAKVGVGVPFSTEKKEN